MSTALKEDEEKIQKHLGCMNKIFLLCEQRYKRSTQGQSVGNKFNNESDKLKDQAMNNIIQEKHKESVESSRNMFSSSCSSLDYSKQVQTEPYTFLTDAVKASITRKPRVVSVKNVAKDEQKGPKMTHVDSPRLLQQHPKHATYERRDQNLVKLMKTCNDVKQPSRFSYDDRESLYKLKSIAIIKDYPRLSLDSKQSSIKHNANVIIPSQIHEPGSNKRPPSSLVARLMGLDLNCEALRIQPRLDGEKFPISRLLRESVSPTVSNAMTRIPLEPAPWKQEVKQLVKEKVKQQACKPAYVQIDKRFTEIEFKTSVKDLIDLKHTLKPDNLTSNSMVITSIQKDWKVNPGRETKASARTEKQVSPSHTTDCLAGPSERNKWLKIIKQSNGHQIVSNLKTRDFSCRDTCHISNSREQSDKILLSDANTASQNEPEVRSKVWTRENKNKFEKSLMGYKPMAEQPSPISILDAFYTEYTPSPIKKKSYAFKDDDDPCFDEQELIRVRMDDLISSTKLYKLTSGSHDILTRLLARLACRWRSTSRRIIDEGKLLEELWFEINNLHIEKTSDLYELINIITEDVHADYYNEVPTLVFNIEQLVFNDLITEIVNVATSFPQ